MLDAQQKIFPEYHVDWQQAVTKWALEDKSRAIDDEIQKFDDEAFKYMVIFSISNRLNSLSKLKWQKEILSDIDISEAFGCTKQKITEHTFSKLAHYELIDQLKEATSMLEIALWKASIDLSPSTDDDRGRERCRIRCGADVVVPNVLSFLRPSEFD